jgi:hypothetical protein
LLNKLEKQEKMGSREFARLVEEVARGHPVAETLAQDPSAFVAAQTMPSQPPLADLSAYQQPEDRSAAHGAVTRECL